ncbi:MAG TPA: hypothetical protein VJP04_05845, partial [Terriglobales bacterium]|nr:hypothetical protein [Terriglobales bacterium]
MALQKANADGGFGLSPNGHTLLSITSGANRGSGRFAARGNKRAQLLPEPWNHGPFVEAAMKRHSLFQVLTRVLEIAPGYVLLFTALVLASQLT